MNDREVQTVIVEDNPNDAELITRVLRKQNLASNIVILKDGAEALDFIFAQGAYSDRTSREVPKVIFLDLKLPKVDGLEVLRRLKSDERTRTIPVVVLTSSTEERDLNEAYELGVNSYVTKPIKFEEFSKVVTELGLYWLELNRLCGR